MNALEPVPIQCPYCWEEIELLVEAAEAAQEYVEDCQVCCKPITVVVAPGEAGVPQVSVRGEDEV